MESDESGGAMRTAKRRNLHWQHLGVRVRRPAGSELLPVGSIPQLRNRRNDVELDATLTVVDVPRLLGLPVARAHQDCERILVSRRRRYSLQGPQGTTSAYIQHQHDDCRYVD